MRHRLHKATSETVTPCLPPRMCAKASSSPSATASPSGRPACSPSTTAHAGLGLGLARSGRSSRRATRGGVDETEFVGAAWVPVGLSSICTMSLWASCSSSRRSGQWRAAAEDAADTLVHKSWAGRFKRARAHFFVTREVNLFDLPPGNIKAAWLFLGGNPLLRRSP